MLHKLREVPVLHIRQGRALKIPNSKEEEGESERERGREREGGIGWEM